MTGRELILYILENGLENEPVFKNDKFIGFVTPEEMAIKLNVSVATIEAYVTLGKIVAIRVGNRTYIPANQLPS